VREAENKKRETTIIMKTPIKLALIGALGVLTSTASLAQPNTGDDTSSSSPPRIRRGFEGPGPEAHRKALLEKYDANNDGQLEHKELTNLGRDVYEGKLPPPDHRADFQGERGGPGFGSQRRGGPDGPGFAPAEGRGPRGDGDLNRGPRRDRMGDEPRPRPGGATDRGNFGGDGGPERPPFGLGPRGFGRPDSAEGKQMAEQLRQELIKQYDVNGDGKLDSSEREAIGKDIEDGKLLPPPLPSAGRNNASRKEQ